MSNRLIPRFGKLVAALALVLVEVSAGPVAMAADAMTGGNSSAELLQTVTSKLKGKKVAWVPTTLGFPLTDMWTYVMKKEAEQMGLELIVKDPGFKTTAQLDAVTALVASKPDVLVVHNFNVQLLAKQLEAAERAGIYVVQVNMVSNYKTDGYVGAEWKQIGRMVGEDVIKSCGKGSGTSGKVAVVQGQLTSAASIEQLAGFIDEVKKDPTIKVVSSQPGDWDATAANNITTTVLQQHPDLCATFGFWGTMQNGAAQAVKTAGKLGQVKVYASGEGNRQDCNNVKDGLFYKFLNYNGANQARAIMDMSSFLLQSGIKPGSKKMAIYSTPSWITKDNFDPAACFDVPVAGK